MASSLPLNRPRPATRKAPADDKRVALSAVPKSPTPSASLERHIGYTVRKLRQQHGLTIADVSASAGISRGMLSKVENGLTATSLETLDRLAHALGVSMTSIFRDYNVRGGVAQLVRRGEGMEVVRRGTKSGHTYQLLAYDQGPTKAFEPFLISIDEPTEVFPTFEHPGTEFIYMLKGQLEYRHGEHLYLLKPGDAFTFDGDVPHGPERLLSCPIRFLSIILYPHPNNE